MSNSKLSVTDLSERVFLPQASRRVFMPTFTQWLPSVTHLSTVLQGSQLFHCVSLSPPRPPSPPPRGFVFSLLQSEEKEYRKVSNGLCGGGQVQNRMLRSPPHPSGQSRSCGQAPCQRRGQVTSRQAGEGSEYLLTSNSHCGGAFHRMSGARPGHDR